MTLASQLLLFLVAACSLEKTKGSVVEEISTGAFLSEIQSPIFYTTFVPIIYEIEVPKWREDDLRIKWPSGHSTNCNTSESVAWTNGVGCPSVYNYNSIISSFFSKTSKFLEGLKSNQGTQVEAPSCEEIQPHFQNTKSSVKYNWDNYLEFFQQCAVKGAQIDTPLKSFSKLDLTRYDYMLKRFYELLMSNVGTTWAGYSTYNNAYSAYQAGALLMHYTEMVRWDQAVSQCNSKQFPRGLVDDSKLSNSLTTLKNKLAGKNFQLSISESNLNMYYTQPLTDCFYSRQNGSYVIRLLVPLRPKNSNFNLVQMNAIPFGSNFNSSSETNLICSLTNIEGKYIHEKNHTFVSKTDCKSNELCFVQNLKSWVTVDPCITAIFENNTENTRNFCETKCYPTSTNRFPMFKRLSSDTFVIIGHSSSNLEIFISCHGNPFKVVSPNVTGALEIQISCDCKIVYKAQEFQAYKPCGSDLVLKHLNQLVLEKSVIEPSSLYAEKQKMESLEGNFANLSDTVSKDIQKLLAVKNLTDLKFEKFILRANQVEIAGQQQIKSLENNFANLNNSMANEIQKISAIENSTDVKFEKLFDNINQIQTKLNSADEIQSKFENLQSNTNGLKESDLFTMKLCIGAMFCILIGLSVAVTFQCFFFKKQLEFMKYTNGRMNPTYNDRVTFKKGEGLTADANLSLEHEYGYVN